MRLLLLRNILVPALVATLLIPLSTSAQKDNKKEEQEKVKASGTLKGFQKGVMHVVSQDGSQYYVKVPDRLQGVTYRGSADADILKAGMYVKFTGDFDKKGQSASPVKEIEVFIPGKDDKPGVTQGGGLGIAQSDLFNDKPKEPKPAKDVTSYQVVGRLTGARSGTITVAAGSIPVRADLAKDASVSLEIADLSWIREGDKVSFDGWASPDQKQNVYATRLEVVATEPLGKKTDK